MKHEFGIKARHMAALGEEDHESARDSKEEPTYSFAVISDKPGRIIAFLEPLLASHGKFFRFHGFDLYGRAIKFSHLPEGRRTVALVVTDGPEDRTQHSEAGLEQWKEAIITFSNMYFQQFIEEVFEDHLPATFTVVLLFHEKYGQLSAAELKSLEDEFLQFHEAEKVEVRSCHSEEELAETLEEEIVERVLKRHSSQMKVKKATKSRDRRIAKATRTTQEAFSRTRVPAADRPKDS